MIEPSRRRNTSGGVPPSHSSASREDAAAAAAAAASEDSDDDLRRLIALAGLPFCRATRTFVSSHPSPAPPQRYRENALADKQRRGPFWIQASHDDANDKRQREAAANAAEDPMLSQVDLEDEEDDAAIDEDDDDYNDSDEDLTAPEEEEEEDEHTSPPAAPGRRRSPAHIRRENLEFIAATFGHSELEGFSACSVCGKHVLCKNNRVRHLLRHAVTRSCLFLRVERRLAAESAAASPPSSSSARCARTAVAKAISPSSPGLSDALWNVWTSYYLPPPATPNAGPLVPRRCRHCGATIQGSKQSQRFFQHIAGCSGIGHLLRAVEAALRGVAVAAAEAEAEAQVPPLPPPLPWSSPGEQGSSTRAPPSRPSGRSVTKESGVTAPASEGSEEPGAIPGPLAFEPLPGGRAREEIDEENRLFLESNFAPAAADSSSASSFSGALVCRVCDKRHARRDSSVLLRHAVSLSCVAWRVERSGHGAEEGDIGSRACDVGSLPYLVSVGLHSGAVRGALREFRRAHFDPAVPGNPPVRNWACRRCGAQVDGLAGNQPFLTHLAACAGVAPVVRALEDILRRYGAVEPR